MSRIFLSYARDDDEPFVRRLHEDLSDAGFVVWFDRVSMPSRRLTFHQEIRDAVAACERLVLIVGPKAVTSEYVRQEWQFAWFEAEKVVTPILRLGDYPLLPDELKLLHCEDFRDETRYPLFLGNLVRQLREPVPPLGKLIAVPSLPAHYLTRADRLEALRDALRADLDRPVVIGGAAARVGMHGMGGIGKTVLASTLARDRKVREAFPDGIIWVGLGSLPDRLALMQRVHRDLGGDGAIATEHEGKKGLKDLLKAKAVLLVLDDAWRRSDVDAFDVLGSRCRALVTTRDAGLLTALGGTHHVVELLTNREARRLLAIAAGVTEEELPELAAALVDECGRLPLALALCGGLVRRKIPWNQVLAQFKKARIDRIADRHAVEPQHQSVWHAIHVSVAALEPADRNRFLELAVFPPDDTIPEQPIATLWEHTGELDDWGTAELLTTLADRSLVQMTPLPPRAQHGQRHFGLHDLVYDYVRRTIPDPTHLHAKLLAAYRAKYPGDWANGPNDGYFLQHLQYHLLRAKRFSEAHALLMDLNWLATSANAGLSIALASNATEILEGLDGPSRTTFLPWFYFLTVNASFLTQHPNAFFQQAYNEPKSSPVSLQAQAHWAAYCTPSDEHKLHISSPLTPPGFLEWINRESEWQKPSCINTIAAHSEPVTSLRFVHESPLLISGSRSGDIIVWDSRTGDCMKQYDTLSARISSVHASTDGRTVAAGAFDGTILLHHAGAVGGAVSMRLGYYPVSVMLSPDAATLVAYSSSSGARIWDSSTCELLLPVPCNIPPAFSWRSHLVAFAVKDEVFVWHCQKRRLVFGGPVVPDEVESLMFDTTGAALYIIAKEKSVLRVDMQLALSGDTSANGVFARYAHDCTTCTHISIGEDGRFIAFVDKNIHLYVLDTSNGYRCCVDLPCEAQAIDVCDRQALVAVSRLDDVVDIIEAHTGSFRCVLKKSISFDSTVLFARQGKSLVVKSGRTTSVWDIEATRRMLVLPAESCYDISCTGVLACGDESGTIQLWDLNEAAKTKNKVECTGTQTSNVFYSEDESLALSVAGSFSKFGRLLPDVDKAIRVWDTSQGRMLCEYHGHTEQVRAVAIDSKAGIVASSGNDRKVRVWRIAGGSDIRVFDRFDDPVTQLWLSAESGSVFTVDKDWDGIATLRMWNIEREETLWNITVDGIGECWCIDSRCTTIAISKGEELVRVWDIARGMFSLELRGHTSRVRDIVFSPRGRVIFSASDDATIKVWDVGSGECLRTLLGHTGSVRSLAVSGDGHWLISGSDDRTAKLWDLGTGECVRTMEHGKGAVNLVALSHAGSLAIVSSYVEWNEALGVWNRSGECVYEHLYHENEIEEPNVDVAWLAVRHHRSRELNCRLGRIMSPFVRFVKEDELRLPDLAVNGKYERVFGFVSGDRILAFPDSGTMHLYRYRTLQGMSPLNPVLPSV